MSAILLVLFYVLAILVGLAISRVWSAGAEPLRTAVEGRILLGSAALDNFFLWAGGSIVLGFLLHQAYYWLYWYAPLPRKWFLGQDRARAMLMWVEDDWCEELGVMIDRHTAKKAVKTVKFLGGKLQWEVKDFDKMMEFKRNWQVVNAIWYRAMAQEGVRGVASAVNAEARYISDIYHGLGVSVVSALVAAAMYCFCEVAFAADPGLRYPPLLALLCIALNFCVAYYLIRMLRTTRHGALGSLVSLRQHFLACALPHKRRDTPDDYRLEHMPDLRPLDFQRVARVQGLRCWLIRRLCSLAVRH